MDRTLQNVRQAATHRTTRNSRPYLRPLLWDNGEAHLLLAQLDPRKRPERVERRSEFLLWSTTTSQSLCSAIHTREGGNILNRRLEAHRVLLCEQVRAECRVTKHLLWERQRPCGDVIGLITSSSYYSHHMLLDLLYHNTHIAPCHTIQPILSEASSHDCETPSDRTQME
jgi:hypothetical protein